jgi:hypothetical protein
MKESFTTYVGGYYQCCIKNLHSGDNSITFDLKYGVAAKDYSEVAKTKDLKPMELNLLKLEEKSKEIYHLMTYAASHEQVFENQYDTISSKVAFFSIILVVVMIVVGVFQTFYLKQKVLDRKRI